MLCGIVFNMDIVNVWKYLLFLGLLAEFSNGYPRYESSNDSSNDSSNESSKSEDFDIIILSQSWPKTVCSQWRSRSPSNECSLPKNNQWSIHGLWPSNLRNLGPGFCNQIRFDPNALSSIRKELTVKWADVHKESSPDSFWKHEWIKHGTCGVTIDSINSEKKYFQKSMELFDKYNMKNILEEAKIIPGKSYPVEKIVGGVNKVLGTKSQVVCYKNKETGEQDLQEIRLCFDKKFHLINCKATQSCGSETDVTY